MELNVGEKIHDLRKEKHYSISKLSELSDVSTGLISQIERNMVVPSVVVLWKIAKSLNTDINFFFEDTTTADKTVISKGSHQIIVTDKGNGQYKLLSPKYPERLLDMTEVTLKGKEEYTGELLEHDGEECGYVIKGTLTVCLKDERIQLNEGDSIYFKCNQPHKYINLSDTDCVSIWSMTPKFF